MNDRLPVPAPKPESQDPVSHDWDRLPEAGEHWRRKSDGAWMLVTELHWTEGDVLHAVSTRSLPKKPKPKNPYTRYDSFKDHLDDFLRGHEPPEDGGAAAWAALDGQMTRALERQSEAGEAVRQTAEDLAIANAGAERRLAGPKTEKKGGLPALPPESQPGAIAERMERASALVTAASKHVEAVAQGQADHRKAHAEAMMGGPKRTMKRIGEGIARLSAYAGSDVEIVQLMDGAPAESPGPIHVYQSTRFMDEEMLVHLAEGGADANDFKNFGPHLVANPEIVERIIPAPVGMCLMRFRRHRKEYKVDDSSAAKLLDSLYQQVQADQANREQFLLHRDGGSLWAVFLPEGVAFSELRLWPTDDDLLKAMDRWGRERLPNDPEALDYDETVQRRSAFEHKYRMLMLTLAGVQEREGMFRAVGAAGWGEAAREIDCVRWIADDERLVDAPDRPDLAATMATLGGERIAPGVRVVCDWAAFKKELPDSHSLGRADSFQEDYSVRTVKRKRNRLYVECPAVRWTPERGEWPVNIRVPIAKGSLRASWGRICAAAIHIEDLPLIETHLRSRIDREGYLKFYGLFSRLQRILRGVRANQADVRNAVLRRLSEEGIEGAGRFAAAAFAWQEGKGDAPLPRHGDSGFDECCERIEALMRLTHTAESDPNALRDAYGAQAEDSVLVNGSGTVQTLTPLPGARNPAGFLLRTHAERRTYRAGPRGPRQAGQGERVMCQRAPGSITLIDGGLAAIDSAAMTADNTLRDADWQWLDGFLRERAGWDLVMGRRDEAQVMAAMNEALSVVWRKWSKSKARTDLHLLLPLGAVEAHKPQTRASAVAVAALSIPIISYGYHNLLSPASRAEFKETWQRHFSRPVEPRRIQISTFAGAASAWVSRARAMKRTLLSCGASALHCNDLSSPLADSTLFFDPLRDLLLDRETVEDPIKEMEDEASALDAGGVAAWADLGRRWLLTSVRAEPTRKGLLRDAFFPLANVRSEDDEGWQRRHEDMAELMGGAVWDGQTLRDDGWRYGAAWLAKQARIQRAIRLSEHRHYDRI